jgi:hypothetical protein
VESHKEASRPTPGPKIRSPLRASAALAFALRSIPLGEPDFLTLDLGLGGIAIERFSFARNKTNWFSGGPSVVPRSYIGKEGSLSRDKLFINVSNLSGTAGWTRTTDLLIHSSAAPTSAFAHCRDDLGMRSTSLDTFRAIVVLDGCPQIAV